MPRAKSKNALGLSMRIDNESPFYTPGATIAGAVDLNTAEDMALGEVTVCLYGRAKVHFVQHHGQGESHWRGRAPLFEETLVLYQGKHTHKPGSFTWPFEFTIPPHPDGNCLREKKFSWKARPHYESTDDYIPNHTLPPTFNFRKWGFGYRYHAYIEYVLETNIKEPEGSRLVLGPRSRKSVMPIILRHSSTMDDITRPLPGIEFSVPTLTPEKSSDALSTSKYKFRSQTTNHTVRSLRLESGNRDEQLSFRKKASSIFNQSKLPSFTFSVTARIPDQIELLDPSGIPLLVSIAAVNSGLTTIPPEMYPTVRVETLSLQLRATTYIRFRGIGGNRNEHNSDTLKILEKAPVNYEFVTKEQSIEQSTKSESSKKEDGKQKSDSKAHGNPEKTDDPAGVNLSKLSGISTTLTSAKFGRGKIESPLVPSFQSYIISREYELKWRIDLDVLGEKVKVENEGVKGVIVTEAAMDNAMAFMKKMQAENPDDEDDDEEDKASDSEDAEETGKLGKKMAGLLSSKRKSKAEEAAEERENVEGPNTEDNELPRYEEAAATSSSSVPNPPSEALPKYES